MNKPIKSARQTAKAAGEKTYAGSACKLCGGTVRYTSTGQCVACHSARAARLYRNDHPNAVANTFPRKTAIAAGQKTYHGRPCKRCGGTEKRTDNGSCISCSVENAARRRREEPERHRERQRLWRGKNPEKVAAIGRKSRQANPERVRNTKARWRQGNIEKSREGNRRRYTTWKRANPEKRMENCARRRSRGKSATPKWLRASGQLPLIQAIYAEARKLGLHVDHDIPIAGCRSCGAVGLHVLANLQMIDPLTNSMKSNRCMACFLQETADAQKEEDRAQAHHDAEPQRRGDGCARVPRRAARPVQVRPHTPVDKARKTGT